MKKQIPSLRHQAALPENAQTVGFARALGVHCSVYFGTQRFIPDAFRFEVHRKTLRLFEVIVTHELHAEKMWRIRMVRDLLEAQGWRLRLIARSAYGRWRNVDLDTGRLIVTEAEKRAAIDELNSPRRMP